MKIGSKKIKKVVFLGVIFIFNLIFSYNALADTIRFKIVAMNPSTVKTQIVAVKVYLPEEVQPNDIVDSGGLDLEYDSQKSLYYVYKQGVTLKPGKTRLYEVEINDVWLIPENEISDLKERIAIFLKIFKGSEYSERIENISQNANILFSEIIKTQHDDTISRSQHIGIFRTNTKSISKLKKEIDAMDKLLEEKTEPLTPDIFDKSKFKSRIPTKTATWLIIFAVVVFVGLLSLVFFFTWYQQSKVTQNIISDAKKVSFGDQEDKTPKQE